MYMKIGVSVVRGDLTRTDEETFENSFVEVVEHTDAQSCAVNLKAQLSALEDGVHTYTYNWVLTSTTASDSSDLETYISEQTD